MSTDMMKAAVDEWIRAWNEVDLDAVERLFAPAYTVNGREVTPEGVKQAIVWLRSTFQDPVLKVDEIVAEADRVAVRWTLGGTHAEPFMGIPATGKKVALSGINIYRFEDGKIRENHESVDVHGALVQLGATFAVSSHGE
jgi:steroid delta-isomerase-like uncharacterized protein